MPTQMVSTQSYFYWNGSKEVAVQAGDSQLDTHADVLKLPTVWVTDPPASAAELARVPSTTKKRKGY